MRLPHVRFTLRRITGAVALLAVAFTVIRYLPHVMTCRQRAAAEDRISQALHKEAAKYRTCARIYRWYGPDYCRNACLGHVDLVAEADRARSRVAHEHAAADYDRAAGRHATMALRCRQATFQFLQPIPYWSGMTPAYEVNAKYQCDSD